MTENPKNQPNKASRLPKGLETSVGFILAAFFGVFFLCFCALLFMEAVGPPDFNLSLSNAAPLLLFVGFGLTIFLVVQRRERPASQSEKISVGLILIPLAIINISFVVGFLNFFLDDFLRRDSALYYILAVFILGMLFSFWYFSYQEILSRSIISIHTRVALLFVVFFLFQYANVRRNQALVLQAYEDHFLPTERVSIYNVEYDFWSNRAYIIVPYSHYDPMPTFWDRSVWGDFYDFELVDGQWQYFGLTGPSSFKRGD
jgi:hypothetical protein